MLSWMSSVSRHMVIGFQKVLEVEKSTHANTESPFQHIIQYACMTMKTHLKYQWKCISKQDYKIITSRKRKQYVYATKNNRIVS